MRIAIIGNGAIASYVREQLLKRGHEISALLLRPSRLQDTSTLPRDVHCIDKVADLPRNTQHMIDCAGHAALIAHGPEVLQRGIDLTTVSIGALADDNLHQQLVQAANAGNATLHLATGAIGALDCLRAARVGRLESVTYVGRKPPRGWKGSPAEARLDLDKMADGPEVHFEGAARVAATEYPKNANVAAAVALAGLGFDSTRVRLIADPGIAENIHEIEAAGDFGRFTFRIAGRALPDNPKSSALAAMSVISALEQNAQSVRFA